MDLSVLPPPCGEDGSAEGLPEGLVASPMGLGAPALDAAGASAEAQDASESFLEKPPGPEARPFVSGAGTGPVKRTGVPLLLAGVPSDRRLLDGVSARQGAPRLSWRVVR